MSGDDDEDIDQDQPEPLATEQPTVDAGDPRRVKRRLTKIQIREREDARFWRSCFESEVGRRCLWGILQNGHPFETRFACGPNGFPQAEATWFHAGEQDLALRIYQKWLADFPLEVMQMHRENDSRFSKAKKDE